MVVVLIHLVLVDVFAAACAAELLLLQTRVDCTCVVMCHDACTP